MISNLEVEREPTEAHSAPDWLLVGKLASPEQRITVASRQALLARLDESLSRSLSVIVSPPGFGKTTLLSEWWRALRARPDLHACWLTVDDLDSEVSRFVAGTILSVAQAGVDVGPLEVPAPGVPRCAQSVGRVSSVASAVVDSPEDHDGCSVSARD